MEKFTGHKDIDYLILLNLSDKDFGHFCSINSYIRNLCRNENLWRQKTLNRFGEILGGQEKILKNKKEETWRNLYIRLVDVLEYLYNMKVFQDDLIGVKTSPEVRFLGAEGKLRKEIKRLLQHVEKETNKFSLEILKKDKWEESFVRNDYINPIIFTRVIQNMNKQERSNFIKKLLRIENNKIRPRLINILFKNFSDNPFIIEIFLEDKRVNPNLVLRDYLFHNVLNIYVDRNTLDLVLNDKRINLEGLTAVVEDGIGNYIVSGKILKRYLSKMVKLGANIEIFIQFLIDNSIEMDEKDSVDNLINKIIKFNKEL